MYMTVLPLDVTKQSFLINADQLGLNYKDTLFVEWSIQSVPIKDNVKRFVTYVALKVMSMTQYDVYFFIKPTSTVEGCFLYDSQLFVSCIRYFLARREDVQITFRGHDIKYNRPHCVFTFDHPWYKSNEEHNSMKKFNT